MKYLGATKQILGMHIAKNWYSLRVAILNEVFGCYKEIFGMHIARDKKSWKLTVLEWLCWEGIGKVWDALCETCFYAFGHHLGLCKGVS